MEWISVKDRLPPDLEEVIYFGVSNSKYDILVGHRNKGYWYNCYLLYSSSRINPSAFKVTHWMPLPEYPKELPYFLKKSNV